MKSLFLTAAVFSTLILQVNADTIQSFTIDREGGGTKTAVVSLNSNNEVQITTKYCNYKDLNQVDQLKSTFVLSGTSILAEQSKKVLSQRAIIASEVEDFKPVLFGGTWLNTTINYTTETEYARTPQNPSGTGVESVKVNRPIIVIDSKVTGLLRNLEIRLMEHNKSVGLCL